MVDAISYHPEPHTCPGCEQKVNMMRFTDRTKSYELLAKSEIPRRRPGSTIGSYDTKQTRANYTRLTGVTDNLGQRSSHGLEGHDAFPLSHVV